jgi:hypothetical protein
MRSPIRPAVLLSATLAVLLSGCEKEIVVDLPYEEPKLVVNGTIEAGQAPIVILTRSQGYFDATDYSSLLGMFVQGATVTIDAGNGPVQLDEVFGASIPPELLIDAAGLIGLDPGLVTFAGIHFYTKVDGSLNGEVGRTYRLNITAEGKTVSSVTGIPYPVPLDSTWFKLAQQDEDDDTLGYAWARLTDPDTMGNAYRFMTRRISKRSNGRDEDPTYTAAIGSSFPDKYINGLSLDFFRGRGRQVYSDNDEDDNEERGKFKVGDTLLVRFISICTKEQDFYNSYESNVVSTGDLFSSPANARSNITNGLGVWAGWASSYDTLYCR